MPTPLEPQSARHRFERRMAPYAGPLLIAFCVLFATRERLCIQGLVSDPNSAAGISIPLEPSGAVFDGTQAFSIELSARIGTAGGGQFCGGGPTHASGLRVYFDAASRAAEVSYIRP